MISVIVPVYNVEEYLEKCLQSIRKQTFKDLEVIMVDDGSTDNSAIICEKYSKIDNRFKLIKKENGGVSSARNVGLDAASGDWIAFVDSDDYIESNMYEVLLKNAIDCGADISCCGIIKDFGNGKKKRILTLNDTNTKTVLNQNETLENYFLYKGRFFCWAPWNKIFHSNVAKQVRFCEAVSLGEDFYYCLQCILNSSCIVYDQTPLYFYMQREGSAICTKKVTKKLFDSIIMAKKAVTILTERHVSREIVKKARCHYCHTLINTSVKIIRGKKSLNRISYIQYLEKSRCELKNISFHDWVRLEMLYKVKYLAICVYILGYIPRGKENGE